MYLDLEVSVLQAQNCVHADGMFCACRHCYLYSQKVSIYKLTFMQAAEAVFEMEAKHYSSNALA